ncbi:MAG: hypothetical protein ACFE7R_04285 [Candidatus Hodarchaeota archaeon]
MSPKKIVFEEPIVRVDASRIQFPRICPVCSEPAEDTMQITVVPNKKMALHPSWDPAYSPSRLTRRSVGVPDIKSFWVPVCEEHFYTDEGAGFSRSYCVAFDAIALAFMVFGLLALGDNLWRGDTIDSWIPLSIIIFAAFLILTYIVYLPGPVESAVKIIGFDGRLLNVWLQFKNSDYREAFMKENAMNAELVKWIMKA